MRFLRFGKYAVPAWLIVVLMVSTIGIAVMAYVLSNSFTLTLEVKEPLSIVNYPSQLSLFPGETAEINVTVMNSASVNYSVVLIFSVNDSEYQANYLSFSDQVYNVTLGQNNLEAWMNVSSDAPAATMTMSVDLVRLGPTVTKTSLTWASVSGQSPLYYIPVTLTNNQVTATPTGFQQQITVDSDGNSADYASNLDNLNWQDGAGNILDSWLESGITSTATASVYWVNLGSRMIAAGGGTLTIYEAIYATNVNCMNTANTGAEPLYTGIYGQYDDGASVFAYYDNFAGTSLKPNWVNNGMTVTINNGVTMAYTTNSAADESTAGLIYNVNLYTLQNVIVETYGSYVGSNVTDPGAQFLWSDSPTAYTIVGCSMAFDQYGGFYYSTSPGFWAAWPNNSLPWSTSASTNYIWGLALIGPTGTAGYLNYAVAGTPPYNVFGETSIYACIASMCYPGSSSNYNTAQWFRIRLYPPSGAMPTAAFSTLKTIV